uniref:Uncharacterized protein n=1 Tax=Anguilla anguilla TaxID=7936 RepID=A0A0E9RC44_ANGAN
MLFKDFKILSLNFIN